jgi:hypothetical protein
MGDVGLGAVIDHDPELGIEWQELPQRRQMRRLHQGIEGEPQMLQPGDGGPDRRAQHPFRIGDVLDHRAEALQLWMSGEPVDLGGGDGGFEIDPADDAFDERRLRRDAQHELGLRHGGSGLD